MTDNTIAAGLGISSARNNIEREILATKTSERRNVLTEVNILLIMAADKLAEVDKLETTS